jgi:hydrogenase maturation protein HypF
LRELFDPADRRFRYPFINCTNCGPRFTIITDIPYDRPYTTMAGFTMCPECGAEYEDPRNRRFHAQPIACPNCGPQVWLEVGSRRVAERDDAIRQARLMLRDGQTVAVKGLGGFHLACDATQADAVAELRRRKLRVDKPFALMLPDLATVEVHCQTDAEVAALLTGPERPIVILQRRPESRIAAAAAPGQDTLGVMLPYTPLHHLLLERDASGFPEALVMTSGNLSEEPIASQNEDARQRLSGLADAILMHDRDIRTRCDDSVVRLFRGAASPLRRSRGYAPFPVRLPIAAPQILAVGGELKNAFCVTREGYAFLSHHVGDLQNYETLQSFEDGVAHFEKLFRIRPEILAHDLHPDYMATRYALERAARENLPAIGVQHHHAHLAACMAENGLKGDRPVIGVAFDGTGYGDDGTIWGGEFLLGGYDGYERLAHLATIPMPGGEAAVHEPWRLALAWLERAGLTWDNDLPAVRAAPAGALPVVRQMLGPGSNSPAINAPLTSSMGRLFDAVSALVGVRQKVNYEAQAAIELEARLDPQEEGAYVFQARAGVLDAAPVFEALVRDLRRGVGVGVMAARFHNGLAQAVRTACEQVRVERGVNEVALSGGVWQNMALLQRAVRELETSAFVVYLHRQVPANDGGIALGQAVVAARRAQAGRRL